VSHKSKNTDDRACNSDCDTTDCQNSRPFAQLQNAQREAAGHSCQHQKRKSSCHSHPRDRRGNRVASVSPADRHHRNKKESKRTQGENRCTRKGGDRDDCHTGWTLHCLAPTRPSYAFHGRKVCRTALRPPIVRFGRAARHYPSVHITSGFVSPDGCGASSSNPSAVSP